MSLPRRSRPAVLEKDFSSKENNMNERAVVEFEKLLGTEGSPWFEYTLDMASEYLAEFTPLDWSQLQSRALSMSECVQERCAEAVGDTGSEDGVGVLTALLTSPYLDVAAIAASELDDMSIALPISFKDKLLQLLGDLKAQQSTRSDDVQRLLALLK